MSAANGLWITNAALQVVIVTLMITRKAWNVYLTFFVYIAFATARTFALAMVARDQKAYFWLYWITEICSATLVAAVLQDILERLMPITRWKTGILYGVCILALSLGLASMPAMTSPGVGHFSDLFLKAELALRIVQATLIVAIALFSLVLMPRWDKRVAKIFAGICLFVAVEIVLVSKYVHSGPIAFLVFSWAKPLAYTLAFVIWTWAFAGPLMSDISVRSPRRFGEVEKALQEEIDR
jgi:hypothetical protein